jgi:adenosylcobinamide-GDP ribazoletransferase
MSAGWRQAAAREAALVLAAVQFMTRLPVPTPSWAPPWQPETLSRAARHFPLVGALVGAICAGAWLLASTVLPPAAAAGIALAVGMLVTGALHEDGLADLFDGLGGGQTRDRALEIMRDSRIGTYGGAALIVSVGLRWAALAALSPTAGACALIAVHALSRAPATVMLAGFDYARQGPAARDIAGGVTRAEALWAVLVALAAAFLALGLASALAAALAAIVGAAAMAAWMLRRLGGYTGDGLGAMEQAAEVAVFLTLVAVLGG